MDRIDVAGGSVLGQAVGTGVPILLVHGSLISTAWDGFMQQPALAAFRLITWHRRGYGESSPAPAGFTLSDQAADAAAVMSHYGVDAAHVVGHSFGGRIALRLLDEHPGTVSGLALLETGGPPVAAADEFIGVINTAVERHAAGDDSAAIDGFLRFLAGPTYRGRLDRSLPAGWFDQIIADAHNFFDIELPTRNTLTDSDASAIERPVLNVIGEESPKFFQHASQWLSDHLAHVTTFRLPSATHLLQLDNPAGLATAVAQFVSANT
ncbi:MAG: alpha/beta fold hydrolase [Acidimicrobiia bacterium]